MTGDNRARARRILTVEDEYLIAMDLKRTLEQLGVEVLGPVPSVAKALDLLNKHRDIDGAVLDINLGGENVFAVCDVLRSRGIPFVFATGYNAEDVPSAYQHIPRFEKPVVTAQVIQAFESSIATR